MPISSRHCTASMPSLRARASAATTTWRVSAHRKLAQPGARWAGKRDVPVGEDAEEHAVHGHVRLLEPLVQRHHLLHRLHGVVRVPASRRATRCARARRAPAVDLDGDTAGHHGEEGRGEAHVALVREGGHALRHALEAHRRHRVQRVLHRQLHRAHPAAIAAPVSSSSGDGCRVSGARRRARGAPRGLGAARDAEQLAQEAGAEDGRLGPREGVEGGHVHRPRQQLRVAACRNDDNGNDGGTQGHAHARNAD
eukprot:scaffold1679_cov254-Prasinococcus_capsulatus_cf.AAC.2